MFINVIHVLHGISGVREFNYYLVSSTFQVGWPSLAEEPLIRMKVLIWGQMVGDLFSHKIYIEFHGIYLLIDY